jgi:4-amino-4-deoxy-L-arabinose transferase-like glycosyltransferase
VSAAAKRKVSLVTRLETTSLQPLVWPVLVLLLGARLAFYLLLGGRYGFHGDELYFIECGRHLSLGYVDHPPLVPWLARLSIVLFGESIHGLRLFPMLAGAGTIALTVLLTRAWGGGGYAQFLAGMCVLLAPVYLFIGNMLNIPVFEQFIWTLCAYFLVRRIQQEDPRWWVAIGVVAGVGLLNKHTMALWGIGIAVGVMLTPLRRDLRTPWPWVGAAIAALIFLPNLLWLYQNNWVTLEFIQSLHKIPRALFIGGQFLYLGPFFAPVWLAGIVFLFLQPERRYRVFAWLFIAVLLVFFWRQSKPYYLAAAYPVLFAAGAVCCERWSSQLSSPLPGRAVLAVMAAGGLLFLTLGVPVLPLHTTDRIADRLFGRIIPAQELLVDFHFQVGWPEHAQVLAEIYRELPEEDRAHTGILALSHNIASAINFYGPDHGLPQAWSGSMTHHLWGPPPDTTEVYIVARFKEEWLRRYFGDVRQAGELHHPLAVGDYHHAPVYVCRQPYQPLSQVWTDFKRFHH